MATLSPATLNSQLLPTLSPSIRALMPRAAVYYYLIDHCFSLHDDTAGCIEREWNLSSSEISWLGIRSCPTHIGNLIAGTECLEMFGRNTLLQTPGFYPYDHKSQPCVCLEWRDECVCDLESWRIDLRPELSARGFILPIRHPRFLFYEALRVFRHARDQRSFLLRIRTEGKRAAA